MKYNFVLICFFRNGKIKWKKGFYSLNSMYNFCRSKRINFNRVYIPDFLQFYKYKICTNEEFKHLYSDKI